MKTPRSVTFLPNVVRPLVGERAARCIDARSARGRIVSRHSYREHKKDFRVEWEQTKDAFDVLKRRAHGQSVTAEEKAATREQLFDVVKGSTVLLAGLTLPLGSVILGAVAAFAPTLLPSEFRDNYVRKPKP